MNALTVPLNDGCVSVNFSGSPYVPARLTGHPDTWCDAECGDIEIESVDFVGEGIAFVDGKWIKTRVVVDVTGLISDNDMWGLRNAIETSKGDDEP